VLSGPNIIVRSRPSIALISLISSAEDHLLFLIVVVSYRNHFYKPIVLPD